MPTVYIGIGSNLGKREKNCEQAIKLLTENGANITRRSSMIETEPWGVKDQPRFINMAVEVETLLVPEELLSLLKNIEIDVGRKDTIRWGPRVIDLDILFYDELVVKTDRLEVPHQGISKREFVLRPLAEIVPDKVHPVLGKKIRELLGDILEK